MPSPGAAVPAYWYCSKVTESPAEAGTGRRYSSEPLTKPLASLSWR